MQENEEKRIEDLVNKAVRKTVEELNKEHVKEIDKLQSKINHLEARLNINSLNSNIPTSKQSIGKSIIQNNREKSNNSKCGKKGHKIHKLEYFKEEEITEAIVHTTDKCS